MSPTKLLALLQTQGGRVIHQRETDHYSVEVRQNKTHRWLYFGGNSIQSAMLLSDPSALTLTYMYPMAAIIEHIVSPTDLLLLGLGGGGLVRYFATRYPGLEQYVVELDPDILDIAKQYFAIPSTHQQHYYQADAAEYVTDTSQKFDVIISDVYGNEQLPQQVVSSQYFRECYARLREPGVLIANVICHDIADSIAIIDKLRTIADGQTLTVDIPNYHNMLVAAYKGPHFSQQIKNLFSAGKIVQMQADLEMGWVCRDVIF